MQTKEIISLCLELADQHIYYGRSLSKTDSVGPSGFVLLWLGIEQILKTIVVGSEIIKNKELDTDLSEKEIDKRYRDVTKNGHKVQDLLSQLNNEINLGTHELKPLVQVNEMFNRRYLKTAPCLVNVDYLNVICAIRIMCHKRLTEMGFMVPKRFEKFLEPPN